MEKTKRAGDKAGVPVNMELLINAPQSLHGVGEEIGIANVDELVWP